MIDVLLFDGDTPYVVTHRVGNVTRSDNLDSLGQELTFDYLYNRHDPYTLDMLTEPGDHIQYVGGEAAIVEGLVTETSDDMNGTVSVTGYDYGYWLNKKEISIQFNGCSTSEAIETLCKDNEIKVNCCSIEQPVTKNYYEEPISDIIKNLIGMATFQTKKKYRLEVRGDTVYVEDYEDLIVDARFVAAENIAPVDVTYNPGRFTITRTIDDMYNHVKVMKDGKVIDEAKDEESIKRFGTKEYVIDDDEDADAASALSTINKVARGGSVELLGDDKVRSGRILEFDEEDFNGRFLVTNCSHQYSAYVHTMSVDLVDAASMDAAVEAVDPSVDQEADSGTDAEGALSGAGDGIATGQYTWPIPGVYCTTTTYPGHTNNARDFPVPYGSTVVAADGGVVNWVQYWDGYSTWGNQSYGNCIRITHGDGRYTLYAHLSQINVVNGQTVSKGQTIGAVGSTGNSTGPHLHMEIVQNGYGIDPRTVYGR